MSATSGTSTHMGARVQIGVNLFLTKKLYCLRLSIMLCLRVLHYFQFNYRKTTNCVL